MLLPWAEARCIKCCVRRTCSMLLFCWCSQAARLCENRCIPHTALCAHNTCHICGVRGREAKVISYPGLQKWPRLTERWVVRGGSASKAT
ncbi:hypothetical protein M441DRAFT_383665 [Trichoderma asperellum CBS 433.97]|uniref:Secreted protein n=1 Tax=Trichoderma asperellum (strain ATCC 204424 / CBS 433.97 / NBRC 101777) TaxID=1042311 RepID=A0A2T3ZBE0_TRIA4|nr:hypothetical protein M441DRAFT_383665 [Trichoderma asperellum CBS 433.97]PTB42128.1 hypothetical protein M441DRAFT_383665 [Trichoderma asperellum CBS 433.97]